MFSKKSVIDNIKTIFYALLLAVLIRSIFLQPFYIPSSSMEPNLLVGDRLFVTKYTYGYSKNSLPFSPKIFSGRIFFSKPLRGDVVVFKTPADNRTDYIKRLIGLPGDEIQFIDGNLYLNDNQILRTLISGNTKVYCGNKTINVSIYEEKLPNGKTYTAAYSNKFTYLNSDKFIIPENNYFFLGDNRDCSKDSRYLSEVGYVSKDNLVGKARFLFFSSDYRVGNLLKFWNWSEIIRFNRFFKKII